MQNVSVVRCRPDLRKHPYLHSDPTTLALQIHCRRTIRIGTNNRWSRLIKDKRIRLRNLKFQDCLNRIQSGKSRGAVEYINVSSVLSSEQFCGKSRDPGHGVSGHVFDGARKDKETLRVELVETPARTNAKGVQYELRSESVRVQMPKTRVVELLAL